MLANVKHFCLNVSMEEMEYIKIPLHGKHGEGKFTLVDGDYDGEYFSQYKWYVSPAGYVVRSRIESPGKDRTSYIYLHREVCSSKKGQVVDHINRNKLDNRSCNLRATTQSINSLNRESKNYRKNKSGYRGVAKNYNRYFAVIRGERIGSYSTPEEAAAAYNEKAKELFGEYAILNEL